MHIIHKISEQMNEQFDSEKCSGVQNVEYKSEYNGKKVNCISVTFIYDNNQYDIKLLFIDVSEFELDRDNIVFECMELLFYDDEDGTPIIIGDECGRTRIVCKDVKFIEKKPMTSAWVSFLDEFYRYYGRY